MSSTTERLDRPLLNLIFVLVLGAVLALINTTIIGVALPQIGTEFDAGLQGLSWVGTGYLLAIAVAIPLSGWSTVRFGLRPTWMVAVGVFALGSLASALAPGLQPLIGARVLQGVGGGALEPIMLTAIAQAAGPARMGRAMGVVAGAIGVGPLVGPILAGAAIQALDWRWAFGAFVPLALLSLVLSTRVLPGTSGTPHPLDRTGLALIGAGSLGVLYGLSQGSRPSGIDGTGWLSLAAGVTLLAAYLQWARRRGAAAVVPLGPTRVRGFLPAATVMLLLGTAIYPLFYGLPQFFQGVLGYGVLASGLLLVPHGAGALVGMIVGGRLSDRYGARQLVIVGALAATAGSLGYVAAGAGAPVWVFAIASVVTGAGTGFVGGPTVSSLYRVLDPSLIPAGSTLLFILNQMGGALGIAAMTVLIRIAGDGATRWGPDAGTTPMLLPALGAAVIFTLARRLPGRPDAAGPTADTEAAAAA